MKRYTSAVEGLDSQVLVGGGIDQEFATFVVVRRLTGRLA